MTAGAVTLAPDAVEALASAIANVIERKPVARLTYSIEEACQALGVGRTYFDEHIRRELRVVRRGKLILIPCDELARWVAESAERAL